MRDLKIKQRAKKYAPVLVAAFAVGCLVGVAYDRRVRLRFAAAVIEHALDELDYTKARLKVALDTVGKMADEIHDLRNN